MQGHAGDDRRWRRPLARRLRALGCACLQALALAAMCAGHLRAAPPGAVRLDRGRFTVLHYPADGTMAEAVLAAAVSRDSFPSLPRSSSRILIMIAPDGATFRDWAGPSAGPATAAVAFAEQRRVVMRGRRAPPNRDDPLRVLRHELAHVALYEYLGVHADRWFDEGYASYAAGEERNDGFLATNVALSFRRMPALAAVDTLLTSARPSVARAGYALALRAVTDLAAMDSQLGLEPLLIAWKQRGSFDLATRRAYAITAERFESEWQNRTRWRFAFLAVGVDSAAALSLLLVCLLPLWQSKRRAQQARLDAMRAREAMNEGISRSLALDSMLGSIGGGRGESGSDA